MLKTYKVSYTVQSEYDWQTGSNDKQLNGVTNPDENEYSIWVPLDAKIEDVTEYPLEDGYYFLKDNDYILRRSSNPLGYISQVTWYYKMKDGWHLSNIVNQNNERAQRYQLTYIGPIVEEK